MHKKWKDNPNLNSISPEDLVNDISDLHYDELSNFLLLLSNKLEEDAIKDGERGRTLLARNLGYVSILLRNVSEQLNNVWKICKPYVDKN